MPALSFRRCTVASQTRTADNVAGLSMMKLLPRMPCDTAMIAFPLFIAI